MNSTLEVSEIFGPTLQGEGPSAGQSAVFIRLRRCNLQCTWCDTRYTWDKADASYEQYAVWAPQDLAAEVRRLAGFRTELIVITGGEPLIWQRQLAPVVAKLQGFYRIEIETNGTILPPKVSWVNVRYNVSPKLANAGMPPQIHSRRQSALTTFAELSRRRRASFKFVVTPDSWARDAATIAEMKHELHFTPPYVMIEGVNAIDQMLGMRAIADDAAKLGWRLTPRLQTLLWENERGR